MRRLLGIGGVTLAIALAEAGLLRVSEWLWRANGVPLTAVHASSITFYLPWLVVLALVTWSWRPARVPWLPVIGMGSTPRDWLIVGVALATSACLYGGSLVQLLSHGVARPVFPLYVLNGALLAPLVEEWIFRGILWRQIAAEEPAPTRSAMQAAVITSVAFALWHLPFETHSPLWIHGLFGASMALLRWRTRSVSPCVVLHGLGNLASILAAG
jgi:membrane protease YdiL (CAAX protease family)